MIEITIPGKPIAKKRPRFARRGKFVKVFNPQESEEGMWITKAMRDIGGAKPMEGPLYLRAIFHMPIPASTSSKRAAQMSSGEIKHTKKPDLDNLVKFVMDCLNGIAWHDDAQVVEKYSQKRYSDIPRTVLKIMETTELT